MPLNYRTTRATRRVTFIILSALLICMTSIASQGLAQTRSKHSARGVRARSGAAKRSVARGRGMRRTKLNQVLARRVNQKARGEEARGERTDKPGEAMKFYLEQRLPNGMTELPLERYFDAKEQMKQMQR